MTIERDIVLWDDGKTRLRLCTVSEERQYQYQPGIPCVTFGVAYESSGFMGYDAFTLFDHFYTELLAAMEQVSQNLQGEFCIRDIGDDTDGYMTFKLRGGRLTVAGQLGATFARHSLHFTMEADQTLVGALREALRVSCALCKKK